MAREAAITTVTEPPNLPGSTVCGFFDIGDNRLQCIGFDDVCIYNTELSVIQCADISDPVPGASGDLAPGTASVTLPPYTAVFQTACTANPTGPVSGPTNDPYVLSCNEGVCYTGLATLNSAQLSFYSCGRPASTELPRGQLSFPAQYPTVANMSFTAVLISSVYAGQNTIYSIEARTANPLTYYQQYNATTATTTPPLLGQSIVFNTLMTPSSSGPSVSAALSYQGNTTILLNSTVQMTSWSYTSDSSTNAMTSSNFNSLPLMTATPTGSSSPGTTAHAWYILVVVMGLFFFR